MNWKTVGMCALIVIAATMMVPIKGPPQANAKNTKNSFISIDSNALITDVGDNTAITNDSGGKRLIDDNTAITNDSGGKRLIDDNTDVGESATKHEDIALRGSCSGGSCAIFSSQLFSGTRIERVRLTGRRGLQRVAFWRR